MLRLLTLRSDSESTPHRVVADPRQLKRCVVLAGGLCGRVDTLYHLSADREVNVMTARSPAGSSVHPICRSLRITLLGLLSRTGC